MDEYIQKLELVESHINRALREFMKQGQQTGGTIQLNTEDALKVIYYLDIMKANLRKIKENMR